MTSALRWAAMRAILMFHNCEGQSHEIVSTDHNFWRERRAEADSNRGPSAYQPNALQLDQTGSLSPTDQFRMLSSLHKSRNCQVYVHNIRAWFLIPFKRSNLCSYHFDVKKKIIFWSFWPVFSTSHTQCLSLFWVFLLLSQCSWTPNEKTNQILNLQQQKLKEKEKTVDLSLQLSKSVFEMKAKRLFLNIKNNYNKCRNALSSVGVCFPPLP